MVPTVKGMFFWGPGMFVKSQSGGPEPTESTFRKEKQERNTEVARLGPGSVRSSRDWVRARVHWRDINILVYPKLQQ